MTRAAFHAELDALRQDMARMGTLVEEAIANAMQSLLSRDLELARQVVAGDDTIDRMETEIEQRILALIALQQPMASDLRMLGAALKIITDLERLADHAQAIAKVTVRLEGQPFIKPLIDIPRMAEIAREMVRTALTAYIRRDEGLARQMIARDDELDALYKQVFNDLLGFMTRDPQTIEQATQLLFVASGLERIGDHATNIGEWTIYMVTGVRPELNN